MEGRSNRGRGVSCRVVLAYRMRTVEGHVDKDVNPFLSHNRLTKARVMMLYEPTNDTEER